MAQSVVDTVQRGFAILPTDGQTNAKKDKHNRDERKSPQKNVRKSEQDSPEQTIVAPVPDNLNLTFSYNKETGETETSLLNGETRFLREVQFDEVAKANEQVYERRGIVFDKKA